MLPDVLTLAQSQGIQLKQLDKVEGVRSHVTYEFFVGMGKVILTSHRSPQGHYWIEVGGNTLNPFGWIDEARLFKEIVTHLESLGASDMSEEEETK